METVDGVHVTADGGRRSRGLGEPLTRARSWYPLFVVWALVIALIPAGPASAATSAYGTTPLDGWSTNGTVYAVKVFGDTVYVGGQFSEARGPGGSPAVPRSNVAAFSATTGEVLSFRADTNNDVRGIDTDGETVWIGGLFSTVNGTGQRRVAAVDAVTGQLDTAFHPDPSAILWGLHYAPATDDLYIGGAFTAVDGVPAQYVAKLDPATGVADPAFQGRANAAVRAIATDATGAVVWVGGAFNSVGGTNRARLAGLDSLTGDAVGPPLDPPGSVILAVDVTEDGTAVFAAIGGSRNRAQAWDTATGQTMWDHLAMGDAQAISHHGGTVYFGFHEGFAGDTSVRMLAADAVTGDLDPDFRPSINTFFGVWAIDAGPAALAAGGTFTTVSGVATRGVAVFPVTAAADVTPPTPPGAPELLAAAATSVELGWSASTDDVAVAGYEVRRDDIAIGSTAAPTFIDTSVEPATTYSYSVVAFDAAGNVGEPSPPTVVSTPPDVSPPTSPTGLAAGTVTDSSIELLWSQSVDDVGVDHYEVSRGGVPIATVTGAVFTDTELTPDTTYEYSVVAVDAAGNRSGATDPFPVTTAPPPDTEPPGVPGVPVAIAATSVTIELFWEPALDDTAVDHYDVARDGIVVGQTSVPSYVDAGLEPALSYSYEVRAVDTSDNVGPWSAAVVMSTEPDTESPSAPSLLTATNVSTTGVSLDWDASSDDVGVVAYRVSRDGVEIGVTADSSFDDDAVSVGVTYQYEVVAEDGAGNRSEPSTPLVVMVPANDVVAIGDGSSWRYLDDGSDQGIAWREPAFDDAAWAAGAAELGYGDGDEATVIESGPARDHHITSYFRHSFVVGDVSAVTEVVVNVIRDDGIILYVNDVEVIRDNLPSSGVDHLTRAPSGINGRAEGEWLSFVIPAGVLVDGVNVVAAEVHQNAPNSSDVSFDLEMILNPS